MEKVCEACTKKDTRALQDRANLAHIIIGWVAEAWEIDEPDWKARYEEVSRKAKEIVHLRNQPKRERATSEVGKEIRHTKYEKGVAD